MSVIVSLTTIPPRFSHIGSTLDGLLRQTAKLDEIRLYIPRKYRRFPDYDGNLPEVPAGVRIVRCDDDFGPASKVLHAVDDLHGSDCKLIYCDDDRRYQPDYFEQMIPESDKRDGTCIAVATRDISEICATQGEQPGPRARPYRKDLYYRLRRIGQICSKPFGGGRQRPSWPRNSDAGFADIARGVGAVLVRPDFFDAAAYDISDVLWSVDDVWLSGQLARLNIPIWGLSDINMPPPAAGEDVANLLDA
ncbi:glycosyltransferase family 2 protein [Yoonia sp. BS5-3]|uniref:Glycosyltransferase family 2 protein n=1 Tax=Yoonia phaeophyticola TaxID=3137369 RepID=A0ABZ2V833_9RHOB